MEDVCKEGDVLRFKVVGKDPKTKKWKLSRKILLPKPEKKETNEATAENN
jgi:polyribonucleotide nucleotidyltransferase